MTSISPTTMFCIIDGADPKNMIISGDAIFGNYISGFRLDEWSQYVVGETEEWILSAKLGKELKDRIDAGFTFVLTKEMVEAVLVGTISSHNHIELDPIFTNSPAATITEEDIERWNSPIASYEHWSLKIGNIVENILNEDNLEILPGENIQLGLVNTTLTISSVHNHDGLYQPIGNYLTGESDPIFLASPAASITTEEINKWNTPVAGYEYWSLSTGEERVVYGFLYNWYAATDVRNIANTGWHVPNNMEFETLTAYTGGDAISGGKLKEVGLTYWFSPNTGATNEVNYNARGTGIMTTSGIYNALKAVMEIWSTTIYNTTYQLYYCYHSYIGLIYYQLN